MSILPKFDGPNAFIPKFNRFLVPISERSENPCLFSRPKHVVGTQNNHLNEHPKQILKLMIKKIFTVLLSKFLSLSL